MIIKTHCVIHCDVKPQSLLLAAVIVSLQPLATRAATESVDAGSLAPTSGLNEMPAQAPAEAAAPASATEVGSPAPSSTATLGGDLTSESTESVRADTSGLLPLWENTGHVERARALYVGTGSVDLGLGRSAQIGLEPIGLFDRTPNAHMKYQLLNRGHVQVAAQVGIYEELEGASSLSLTPMYIPHLSNPGFNVELIPVALSVSWAASDAFELHQSLTELSILSSGNLAETATLGYTLAAEFHVARRHSLVAHAGEIGFWNHDFSEAGVSYRYQGGLLELQAGAFARSQPNQLEAVPTIGVGFSL